MKNLKKLTILHSNDLHGDFTAEKIDNRLVGGVSMLSGYVQKVRQEEENVIYAIAGDMFRGSLIDSESKGLSTIEIMNMLTPDVVTLGNHEVDYGIAHLLFLEKCARFPIVNSNIYIKTNGMRMFRSHFIKEIDGMKVLFIGLMTQDVILSTKQEKLIGTLVDVHDAAQEVGKICDAYKTEDIDFTVLLTHIGFDRDKELAGLLNPDWGVDIIIGGHSHTLLTEPCVINNIPIVQVGTGTDQIGRFDIMVDTDNNKIDSYKWQLIPITAENCPVDTAIEEIIQRYTSETDKKYSRYITRLGGVYTHPTRDRETQLGKIFTDVLADSLGVDIMFLGGGSLRKEKLGPVVLYRDLVEMFPYDESIYRITVSGTTLKKMITHAFRTKNQDPKDRVHCFQISNGLSLVRDFTTDSVRDITYDGKTIDNEHKYRVGVQQYHYRNIEDYFNITEKEATALSPSKVIATSAMAVLDEYMSSKELITVSAEDRWITVE